MEQFAPGTAAPHPPVTRYGDYAAWQRDRLTGPGPQRDLAYWCAALAGVPPLELATDRPRPAEQQHAGAGYEFVLDADLGERVRRLGAADAVADDLLGMPMVSRTPAGQGRRPGPLVSSHGPVDQPEGASSTV